MSEFTDVTGGVSPSSTSASTSTPASPPRRKLSLLQASPTATSNPSVSGRAIDAIRASLRSKDLDASVRAFDLTDFDRVLKTTISLCPECVTHAPAIVYTKASRVWLRKRCETHGLFDAVLENDERFYFLSNKDTSGRRFAEDKVSYIPAYTPPGGSACCGEGETCGPSASTDQLANKTCTVLVEVTDACNLACPVCYSDAKGDRKMPLDVFQRYMLALLEKKGTLDSVQLTGGEAMLHPEFWDMVAFLYAEPRVKKIFLPTNGILLAQRDVAARLAPFRSKMMVLLQFDGESDATDVALRAATPKKVRTEVVRRLGELGVPMQLTMTLARGVNDDEIGWVIATGLANDHVKVIALQPATYSGRYDLARDAGERLTLSDVAKAVAQQTQVNTGAEDFVPIPCSHPNCGWITLYVRRFGITRNVARYVDLPKVIDQVAYKTLLSTAELEGVIGTSSPSLGKRALGWLARKLVRSTDVFTVAIKPFMDKHSYDQDRIANCCHHLMDTNGVPTSFCEYNAMQRPGDSWEKFPAVSAEPRHS